MLSRCEAPSASARGRAERSEAKELALAFLARGQTVHAVDGKRFEVVGQPGDADGMLCDPGELHGEPVQSLRRLEYQYYE